MKLFFRLGMNANLAYAEIIAFLKQQNIQHTLVQVTPEVAIFEITQTLSTQDEYEAIINKLGGTVKIGEVVDVISEKDTEALATLVHNQLESIEGKKVFGFSLVGTSKMHKELYAFGLELKKKLGSARFVTSKEKELSSVIVKNEKLLRKGAEFILIPQQERDSFFVGVTKAVQDFKGYEKRDFGRPRFDDVSGMLPPKVAQMMIHLAGTTSNNTRLLDPFCGSGTLLQEMLLLGYQEVIGADISQKAIDDTQANLEWLEKEYAVSVDNVELYNIDAKELAQHIDPVDAIITEPYLGPALKGRETKEQLMHTKRELEELYMRVFKTYAKILKKKGRVVTVVPAFKYKNDIIYLDILNKLQSHGFVLQTGYKNVVDRHLRYPLTYSRPDSKLIREIFVLEYKG